MVTIVCDHSFHCECLRRWSDSSCPVCRHVSDDSQSKTACEVCGTTDSLWICLVCGHVGCGRYTGCGAGVHHNTATDHSFAMELATQRVWDYKGDSTAAATRAQLLPPRRADRPASESRVRQTTCTG